MTGLGFDTSQIDRLAVDLSEAPGRIKQKAPAVFARGAFEIKNRIKRAATGHQYLPGLERHVSYDKRGPLDFEIGFDKVGQGRLANIAAYGSINNAPIMETPAMLALRELAEIGRHLADEGEDAVLGGNQR